MADVKGIMMGGAGHDAAAIVAALIPGLVQGEGELSVETVVSLYETYRDALLASNEKAQAASRPTFDVPEDPARFAMPFGKYAGKTLAEIFDTPAEGPNKRSGAETLTYYVANFTDKPDIQDAIRRFLSERNK